ncbi:SBBP repeat-containing protein [Methanococcus maripaludis]|uniref:Bulb-type lectin domain-containing protein n=1 Tax=Methanococcus maripaludis TaxID=39152 RepID=A0A7J9S1Z7_METMI|nr:SBBP repeat-containing protein [Methanococcus maripaludis]MBB6067567.1 hypothetical protein [Methanococcus maripaludis]
MKIRHFIITSFIFLLCASFVNAEEAVWNDTFGYGYGWDIAVDGDGNSYVTGGSKDVITLKYSPNGTRLWNSTLDFGATSERGNSIALDESGNAYVTGRGNDNFVTIKYAPNGTILWNNSYDYMGSSDGGNSIALDNDGNAYVTGDGKGGYHFYCIVLKYAPNGTLLWNSSLTLDDTHGWKIALDDSGNAYVTGDGDRSILTAKYAPNGTILWDNNYPCGSSTMSTVGEDIALDNSGNAYVAGIGNTGVSGDYLYITLKYAPNGTLLWNRTVDLGGYDQAFGIEVDALGNAYVTGCVDNGVTSDIMTIKYAPNGTQEWNRSVDYNGQDSGQDIALDESGNAYVTGYITDSSGQQVFVIKYSPNGSELWNSTCIYWYYSYGISIALDDSGNAYVTGSIPGYEIATVKFGIPVDETAPEVTINTLEKSYNTTSIVINVTATDLNLDSVIAEINGTENITLENISGNYVNSTYEFSEGLNTLKIYANDTSGNVNSSENISFIVDTTNPELRIETSNVSNTSELTINVTATDNIWLNYTNISIVDNSGNLVNSTLNETNGTYMINLSVPADGIYNISATSFDMVGNTNKTEAITLNVDENAPVVTINTLEKSYNTTSIVINVTATDLNLDSVIAEINGTENITLENISGYFVNSTYEFSEGLNTLKIYANDSFEHINSNENITFRIDLNLPVITVNIEDGKYFNNGSNVLNFTVDEDYIDSVTAFNGSTEILLNNSTGNYLNSVALNEGIYNITIRINDTAGNIDTENLSFTVDTSAPVVAINNPVNGTTFTTSSVSINVSANDSLSNVSSVVAQIGSIKNVTLSFDGKYYTGSTGSLSNGNYEIKIIANDLVGNINSNETVNITVAVPSSSSSRSGSSHSSSSEVSDDIESDSIRDSVSDSDVVYGNSADQEYAGELKENLYDSEDYEISGDTIIVGGPESNALANRYDSEFDVSISNDYPGENRGVIQVMKVQDNSGKVIQSYTVIYIAGSDRLGTQTALEYFKTLDELPDEPITVKWTANGPVVVE